MGDPKTHHYLPQFYLTRFTPGGPPEEHLWVLLFDPWKQWQSLLSKVAKERGFYRVENEDGVDPLAFEKSLADLESKAAPVVRSVVQTERLPPRKSDDYVALMNFLAMQAARVPATRDRMASMSDLMTNVQIQAAARSRGQFEESKKALEERGEDMTGLDYEPFSKWIMERRYEITHPQGEHMLWMTKMHGWILPTFYDRHWCVLVRRTEPYLVTSDNPVVLSWTNP